MGSAAHSVGSGGHEIVPPEVAAGLHGDVRGVADAAQDDYFFDGGRVAQGFVDAGLERDDCAAAPRAVGGDDDFGLGVVDALAQRFGGKSAKDDAVRRANFGAREHGDGQLRHHAHVNRDAVAFGDAKRAQRVGEAVDFALEHAVGEHARIAGFAFPDDGGFVAALGMRVAIDAVVRDVQLAAGEPFGPRSIPLEHIFPRLKPVEALRLGGPEGLGITRGAFVNFGVCRVGLAAKFGMRRKRAALLEQRGEADFGRLKHQKKPRS